MREASHEKFMAESLFGLFAGTHRSPALANAHSYAISDVDSRHELKHGVIGGDHSIFIEL
jgi:hypothetical protein